MKIVPIVKQLIRWTRHRLPEPLIFLHLPKCGGTSLDETIARHCPLSYMRVTSEASFRTVRLMQTEEVSSEEEFEAVLRFREQLQLYYMSQGIEYISGHLCFSQRAYQHFSPPYQYVTLLRDPVERWISQYFFDRYRPHAFRAIDEELEVFIHTPRARSHGYQYVRMLGGLRASGDYASQQAIRQAQENLGKFAVVGCLENSDDFLMRFRQRFGLALKIPRRNVNPASRTERDMIMSDELKQQIARLCEPDISVYAYARDTFAKNGQE